MLPPTFTSVQTVLVIFIFSILIMITATEEAKSPSEEVEVIEKRFIWLTESNSIWAFVADEHLAAGMQHFK